MEAFRDPSLPLEKRIKDLISRLSLQEKTAQMLHEAPPIERLGIPAFSWWNEGLHGVARAGLATVFPQAIGMAASFDPKLLERVADAISTEMRAKFEVFSRRDVRGRYCGLTFWTPNINIFRDPRWGRGQETYGEDPWLTARMGVAFVRGLQGEDPSRLKTAACAKHFAVHSGPEALRHEFDVHVSPRDLEETYLFAFRELVKAGIESVMGAYNRVNGEPCCGSDFLLRRTLRGEWGFKGHVVSDCWALVDFHQGHKVVPGPLEAAALALEMGCDLNCGCTYEQLHKAVEAGLVSEAKVDESLSRLLSTRFRLGLFDPPGSSPWEGIPASKVRSAEHLALAEEAALRSMVLLKNDGILPLDKGRLKSLYITGPSAMSAEALIGNYHGFSPRFVTYLEGITEEAGIEIKTDFRHGCLLDAENRITIDWASFESALNDVTIACVGLNLLLEGEEGDAIAATEKGDRSSIALPSGQHKYLMKLFERGKPVILVVSAGSAIDLSPYYDKAAAIVWAWYPGELGGKALAELLFGKADFQGRLPVSFPRAIEDLPPFEDYSMAGRTYRFSEKEAFFPFGFGLAYGKPLFGAAKPSKASIAAADCEEASALRVELEVRNPGPKPIAGPLMLFVHKDVAGLRTARWELAGLSRYELTPGASATIGIDVDSAMVKAVGEDGARLYRKGKLTIAVGTNLPGARSEELGAPPCRTIELEMR
jgi:beta-glucosidase